MKHIPLLIVSSLSGFIALLSIAFLLTDQPISLTDTTGAVIVSEESATLQEGYSQEVDINEDGLSDATMILLTADDGTASFQLEKHSSCKQN